MARTRKAGQLRVGDWFGDPHRAPLDDGRLRPAKVVKVHGVKNGSILFDLDDNTKWRPWIAGYPVNQELELL